MSEIVFKAIYINLNDHIYICYARKSCMNEHKEDLCDKINFMFGIQDYDDWRIVKNHFKAIKDNSGEPLLKTEFSCPHKHVGNIDVVIEDNEMSLVFYKDPNQPPFICTARNKAEFEQNIVKLEYLIREY